MRMQIHDDETRRRRRLPYALTIWKRSEIPANRGRTARRRVFMFRARARICRPQGSRPTPYSKVGLAGGWSVTTLPGAWPATSAWMVAKPFSRFVERKTR